MPLYPLPELTTPRLIVREVEDRDLPDLALVNGDDEVTRHLPYASWCTAKDSEDWLARMRAMADAGLGRQYVVVLREPARVIGSCLLHRHEAGSARAELGYVLGRAHWGRGLMHEALQALLDHAFDGYALRRIEAEVNPANLASIGLLRRLGFRQEGLLRARWCAKGVVYDTQMHGLLRDDYRARAALAAPPRHG